MTNLLPHHRFHIPNGLAVFAALLLLASSVVGFDSNQEGYSASQETMTAVKASNANNDKVNDSAGQKSRGLNLGLLLFRRG